jgi:hypothetical protein
MKKSSFLLLFLFGTFFANAQYPFSQLVFTKNNNSYSQSNARLNKTKTIEITHFKKNTEKVSNKNYYEYLPNGNFVEIRNSKRKTVQYFQWKNDSLLLKHITIRKGDTSYYEINSYDENGKKIQTINLDGKRPKVYHITENSYNTSGKLIKSTGFDKNKKVKYHYEYDFYENGTPMETRLYNKKGKLKSVYTYTCDPKGEVEKDIKKVNYCTSKTMHPDGSFFEVVETQEKGKMRRNVYSYSADSLLIKYENFDLKGKCKYTTIYTYNQNKKLLTYQRYKGTNKLLYAYTYFYNEKDLIEKEIVFNKKNKIQFTSSNTYTFFE